MKSKIADEKLQLYDPKQSINNKGFNSFLVNLQILPKKPVWSGVVLNTDCRDTELPANGDCDDGWLVQINSTLFLPDETASIECLECKIQKTRTDMRSIDLNSASVPTLKLIFICIGLDLSNVNANSTVSAVTDINERPKASKIIPEVSSGKSGIASMLKCMRRLI